MRTTATWGVRPGFSMVAVTETTSSKCSSSYARLLTRQSNSITRTASHCRRRRLGEISRIRCRTWLRAAGPIAAKSFLSNRERWSMELLKDLQDWYRAQCDGDWEHTFGALIETIDNPGWMVKIDLRDTQLEESIFASYKSGHSDDSWIECKVEGRQFIGVGDPSRLEEIINHFIQWAKDRANWLAPPDTATETLRNDRELWEHLGKSYGAEACRVDGCHCWRIRHSVFCRVHHWEKVLGRACPFKEGSG